MSPIFPCVYLLASEQIYLYYAPSKAHTLGPRNDNLNGKTAYVSVKGRQSVTFPSCFFFFFSFFFFFFCLLMMHLIRPRIKLYTEIFYIISGGNDQDRSCKLKTKPLESRSNVASIYIIFISVLGIWV